MVKIDYLDEHASEIRKFCEDLWDQSRQLAEKSHQIVGKFPRIADDPESPATGVDIAERSVRHILALVSGRSDLEDPEFITRLGKTRAEAGVPVDQILGALNADFEIVWASLLELEEVVNPRIVGLLGSRMWRSVEKYSTDLLAVYKEREAALRAELQPQSNRFLNGLASGTSQSVSSVRSHLLALGVTRMQGLAVVVGREQLDLTPLTAQGIQHLAARTESGNCIVILPERRLDELLMTNLQSEIVYETSVTDESLQGAVFLLNVLLSHSTRLPGHRELDDVWWDVMVQGLGNAGHLAAKRILHQLLQETPPSVDRLAEAVDALWVTAGVSQAARLLQVHRNTFVKRCEKLSALTGFDPRIPAELAMLKLAFDQLNAPCDLAE